MPTAGENAPSSEMKEAKPISKRPLEQREVNKRMKDIVVIVQVFEFIPDTNVNGKEMCVHLNACSNIETNEVGNLCTLPTPQQLGMPLI